MKRSLSLLVLGMVAYGLFLVTYLPMSLALKWSGVMPEEVRAYGVRGTILDGEFDALLWQNWRLDRIRWRFAPLQLFRGRIAYSLRFTNPDGSGEAITGIGIGGTVHMNDLMLRLPLKYLSRQWSLPTRFGGLIEVDLTEFSIEDGAITAADGALIWSDAHLRASPPVALGTFNAHIEPLEKDGELSFEGPISDNGGAINASGAMQLSTNGNWQIRGKLALRDSSNTSVAHLLNSLGSTGADGTAGFELKGKLPLPQPDLVPEE